MRKMLTQFFSLSGLRRRTVLAFILVASVLATYARTGPVKSFPRQEIKTITGTVVDGAGNSLPGVSVYIKGTSEGTITDMDGKYTIKATSADIIVFSFVGYLTEEIPVREQTTIDVTMVEDIIGLDEVVVTGYGVQKKSDLTGAVASVSSEALTQVQATSVNEALQGRAAGVSVTQNTGMPGGQVTIQIRGISSINGSGPLVMVDGVRGSLDNLNPSDIESVEILKDAASAAIYGSSGGNGVILVTTKKGKSGKLTTNFNMYIGQQKPWKKMDVMNSQEYADVYNYWEIARVGVPRWTQAQVDSLPNYDWQDIMFRKAIMQNYDFSVQGGNETSRFFLSINYIKQEGIMRKSDYERYSIRINSDHRISKYLKVGENTSFTKTQNLGYQEWVFQNEYNSPMTGILTALPYLKPYDDNGVWSLSDDGRSNPKVAEDMLDRVSNFYSVGGNGFIEISPLKGLTITSKINAYTNFTKSKTFNDIYYHTQNDQNENRSLEREDQQQLGWEWQNYINYDFSIAANHNFTAMIGYEALETVWNNTTGIRYGIPNKSPEQRYFSASADDSTKSQIVEGTGWEDAQYAYFARLNYNYKGKYLVSLNLRRDGSSRFGPDYRFGTFPSWSVGWKFSEEEFTKNLGLISFGKLRIGRGTTGANAPDRYAYFSTVSTNNALAKYNFTDESNSSPGSITERVPNTEMHWETMIMTNVGVDLGLLNNKLIFTADWFSKESDGMLARQSLQSHTGYYQYIDHLGAWGVDSRPIVNLGTVKNSGFEFTLGYKEKRGSLKYSFDLNTTFLKNKVSSMPEDSLRAGSVHVNLQQITLTSIGQPISQFNGWQTDGLFTYADGYQSGTRYLITNQPYTVDANGDTTYADPLARPGDFRIVDQNKDGKIDEKDRVPLGSPIPKVIVGFSTNLEYKLFDLNLFFEGKFGHKLFYGAKIMMMPQDKSGGSGLALVKDQYREPIYDDQGNLLAEGNIGTDLPRYNQKNFSRITDFYVEPGNYLRLKNLQFGVTIPKSITSKVGIDKFRFYVGVRNLITITRYSGFDPEIATSDLLAQGIEKAGSYPQNIMYTAGLNVQF